MRDFFQKLIAASTSYKTGKHPDRQRRSAASVFVASHREKHDWLKRQPVCVCPVPTGTRESFSPTPRDPDLDERRMDEKYEPQKTEQQMKS